MAGSGMMVARVLLTVLLVVQGLATVLIDVNRTHATNPMWLGHARFHVVWQSLTQALLSAAGVAMVWWPGAQVVERFYLGALVSAVPCLGFVLAQASRGAYGGTLSDPNGIPPLPVRLFGRTWRVDGNAAAVYVALVVLAVLVMVVHEVAGAV